jgi:hypothetical protein
MTGKNKIGWGIIITFTSLWAWNTYLDTSAAISSHFGEGVHKGRHTWEEVCGSFTNDIHWDSMHAQMMAAFFGFYAVIALAGIALHLITDEPKKETLPTATVVNEGTALTDKCV